MGFLERAYECGLHLQKKMFLPNPAEHANVEVENHQKAKHLKQIPQNLSNFKNIFFTNGSSEVLGRSYEEQ